MTAETVNPVELRTIASPFDDGATSLAARATADRVGLYDRAEAAAPRHSLPSSNRAGQPLVFLVVGGGGGWLQVKVPLRPNGTTAWIRQVDVRLTQTRYQIEVVLGARQLTLRWGHRRVLAAPVAVGRQRTPTPAGDFYVVSSVKATEADPLYGSYALGLSGFSDVLSEFNGGEGQLGLHGTGRPDLIGQAVTAGCVRLLDTDAREVSRRVPLGTPIRIRP